MYKVYRSSTTTVFRPRLTTNITEHLCNTLRTSTYFYRLNNQRPITRLTQSTARYSNLPFSTIFCHILPTYFYRNIYNIRNVRNFCQDYDPNPILPRARINLATKLTIYTLFSLFPYFLSLRNVLTLLYSLYTQLNNIYFAIYYRHSYLLRNTTLR